MSVKTWVTGDLNPWARRLLDQHGKLMFTIETVKVYPDGLREIIDTKPYFLPLVKKEISGETYTDLENPRWQKFLYKYTLPDGRIFFEAIQIIKIFEPFPKTYLALQDEKGDWVPESLWPKDAIQ